MQAKLLVCSGNVEEATLGLVEPLEPPKQYVNKNGYLLSEAEVPQVYVVVEGLEIRIVLHHLEMLRARVAKGHPLGEAVGDEDHSLLRFGGVGYAGFDSRRR